MSAVDDLVELVERASAVERAALASKWKDRQDLEAMARSVQRSIDQQRDLERRSRPASGSTARWDRVRADLLAGDPEAVPVVPAADASPPQPIAAEAARAEADAQAAVTVAQLAL